MGFFDSVKNKAGALAADAERAGKVTAAQARLVVLQTDLKKAERELGHAALSLIERGDLDHPELAHAVERVRATAADVRAKEREIAELRGEMPTATPDAASPATTGSAADTHGAEDEAEERDTSAPEVRPQSRPPVARSRYSRPRSWPPRRPRRRSRPTRPLRRHPRRPEERRRPTPRPPPRRRRPNRPRRRSLARRGLRPASRPRPAPRPRRPRGRRQPGHDPRARSAPGAPDHPLPRSCPAGASAAHRRAPLVRSTRRRDGRRPT